MKRILIVETASPKRIYRKVEQILENGTYPESEIVILCQASSRRAFTGLPGVKICPMTSGEKHRIPKELNRKNFDIVFAFWTGEKEYRWMKLLPLRIKAGTTYITAGDGNEFRLTWKAICRHTIFRMKHPLPTDHYDYASDTEGKPAERGERILIVQSAEPIFMLKTLEKLEERSLFHNPRYTIFCRNLPEAEKAFRNHPMLDRVLIHSEARESWKHLRNLRRERFDAIVLPMTGDPSYRKVKFFAFLLGIPLKRILIFNETVDCFFFRWSLWLGLVLRRMREGPKISISLPTDKKERVLIIQSAEPAFLLQVLEKLKEKPEFRNPCYTIFCRNLPEAEKAFRNHPMLDQVLIHSEARESWKHLRNLRRERFDAIVLPTTGDPSYRKVKFFAFLLGVPLRRILIFNETVDCFFFKWSLWLGLVLRRMREGPKISISLPTDKKERVLIVQSAEPAFILKALEKFKEKPEFRNPRYTIFCRNRPEAEKAFRNHPMLDQVLIHSEARESWKHLRNLRRQRFDAIVLFMTGDPSYRKVKVFAFLLGVPLKRILVFNETIDCFFFNWTQWFGLVSRRMLEQPNLGNGINRIPYAPISSITKIVLLPFRFFWLILVWARLRLSGINSSRKKHDYSLQLPPFPGA